MKNNFIHFFIILLIFSSCNRQTRVDLIIEHGKVYTVDSGFDMAEAFAVNEGKIIDIGSNKEILGKYITDSLVDANGRAVYPGFIDAHAHFLGYAQDLFVA